MSSTNKTENIGLSKWIGSDKPQRSDFNRDNDILDMAIFEHISNYNCHVTTSERNKWNNYIFSGVYFGNGSSKRTISTACTFNATFGFIFADSRPLSIVNFSENKKYNYSAFFGHNANSLGVEISDDGKSFQVSQSSGAEISNEYMNLNEIGVSYQYILFR